MVNNTKKALVFSQLTFLATFGSLKQLWAYMRGLVTDPSRVRRSDKGNPHLCKQVYPVIKVIYPDSKVEKVEKSCSDGTLGCVECKQDFFKHLVSNSNTVRVNREEEPPC